MRIVYIVGIILFMTLLNHVFVISHPIFIMFSAFLLIITGFLFMFYSVKKPKDEIFYINNMNLMSAMFFTGFLMILIEFAIPYWSDYTGYMLPSQTSTFFGTLSMNLFTGAMILVGISILGGVIYYIFIKKISYN